MYIIIYIVLIFLLFIYECNIEGFDNEKIKIIFNYNNNDINLNVNPIDTIKKIKNELIKNSEISKNIKRENLQLIYNNLILNDDNDIQYYDIKNNDKIIVKSSIYVISETNMDSDKSKSELKNMYKKFIDSLKKISEYESLHKKKKYIVMTDKLYSLFSVNSKPVLKSYNDKYKENYGYLDRDIDEEIDFEKDDKNEILREIKEINKLDDDDKICCNKTRLNIEQQHIKTPMSNISQFIVDKYYISSDGDLFKPYNQDYYKFMKSGNNIYEYMVGSMKNFENSGTISLK